MDEQSPTYSVKNTNDLGKSKRAYLVFVCLSRTLNIDRSMKIDHTLA